MRANSIALLAYEMGSNSKHTRIAHPRLPMLLLFAIPGSFSALSRRAHHHSCARDARNHELAEIGSPLASASRRIAPLNISVSKK